MNEDQNRTTIILDKGGDYQFLKLTREQMRLLRWLDESDYFRSEVSYTITENIDPVII